jgi:hypothetical protein
VDVARHVNEEDVGQGHGNPFKKDLMQRSDLAATSLAGKAGQIDLRMVAFGFSPGTGRTGAEVHPE